MNTTYYDFESGLEQGFKSLFAGADLELRIADDIGEGELPDECLRLEIDTGGPISDEHQNSAGIYDNYAGTFTVVIDTPRVSGDQTATSGSGFRTGIGSLWRVRARHLRKSTRQYFRRIGPAHYHRRRSRQAARTARTTLSLCKPRFPMRSNSGYLTLNHLLNQPVKNHGIT